MPPADGSLSCGRSTCVCGQVRRPHVASMPRAAVCVRLGQTDRGIAQCFPVLVCIKNFAVTVTLNILCLPVK